MSADEERPPRPSPEHWWGRRSERWHLPIEGFSPFPGPKWTPPLGEAFHPGNFGLAREPHPMLVVNGDLFHEVVADVDVDDPPPAI